MEKFEQVNIFELTRPDFRIKNKIRLIELFGGIGSQAKALENLNANFEHYKLVEFDPVVVKSYNAIHNTNFEPLDITKIHASDLNICDTYLFTYLLTYSFPCQDLSIAGKRKGMNREDQTRSGLLWEVERLLKECKDLPNFNEWILFLERLGYSNYWEDLNAKDYGIPQNRNRCFMVSILGNYNYSFPRKQELKLCLRDMLEKAEDVDPKYFLTAKQIENITNWNAQEKPLETLGNTISKTLTTRSGEYTSGMQLVYDKIPIKNATSKGYLEAELYDGVDIGGRMKYHRGTVQKGMAQTLTTQSNNGVVVKKVKIIGKYTKGGFSSGMVVDNNGIAPTVMEHHGNVMATNTVNLTIKKDTNNYIEWEQPGYFDIDCRAYKEDAIAPTTTTTTKAKVLLNNLAIRRLTPKEHWRLMGFTDLDYEKASKVCTKSQLLKQAGNSIVVQVLENIFKQML